MILRSHDNFDTLADYDPATRARSVFSKRGEPERASSQHISGFFSELGGKRILFYRLAGSLYVDVDGRRVPFAGHTIELMTAGRDRTLRMLSGADVVLEVSYDQEPWHPSIWEVILTPFAEEEHFDFGLFLENVWRDPARQARMFGATDR